MLVGLLKAFVCLPDLTPRPQHSVGSESWPNTVEKHCVGSSFLVKKKRRGGEVVT